MLVYVKRHCQFVESFEELSLERRRHGSGVTVVDVAGV